MFASTPFNHAMQKGEGDFDPEIKRRVTKNKDGQLWFKVAIYTQ